MKPEKIIQDFFQTYRLHSHKKGAVLLMPSDFVKHAIFLERGKVTQYAITDSGSRINITMYKPGTFFPMLSVLNELPNRYYFEVSSLDAEIRKAPSEDVVCFLKNYPEVVYDLLRRMYRGLDGVLDRLIAHMSGTAEIRVRTELRIYADRFGTPANDNSVEVQITDQELASQTGMARETVSRVMAELKSQGIIHRVHKGVVVDLERLKEMA